MCIYYLIMFLLSCRFATTIMQILPLRIIKSEKWLFILYVWEMSLKDGQTGLIQLNVHAARLKQIRLGTESWQRPQSQVQAENCSEITAKLANCSACKQTAVPGQAVLLLLLLHMYVTTLEVMLAAGHALLLLNHSCCLWTRGWSWSRQRGPDVQTNTQDWMENNPSRQQ